MDDNNPHVLESDMHYNLDDKLGKQDVTKRYNILVFNPNNTNIQNGTY